MAFNSQMKKTCRQNSSSAIVNLLNRQPSQLQFETSNVPPVAGSNVCASEPEFFVEISEILRAFGDCDSPSKETVCLVQKIMLQQISGILSSVEKLALQRSGKPCPQQQDFEYLMRHNPAKVFRLQKFTRDYMMRKKYENLLAGRPAVSELESSNLNDEDSLASPEVHDDEKVRRLFRADRISQSLSGQQYKEFCDARRTSFLCRNSQMINARLKHLINLSTDAIISPSTSLILGYLAYETIAIIADLSILTRLNSVNRQIEPLSRNTSNGTSYNMIHLCPEVTQGRGMDGVKQITIEEVLEAMRRVTTTNMGMQKNIYRKNVTPLLAII